MTMKDISEIDTDRDHLPVISKYQGIAYLVLASPHIDTDHQLEIVIRSMPQSFMPHHQGNIGTKVP